MIGLIRVMSFILRIIEIVLPVFYIGTTISYIYDFVRSRRSSITICHILLYITVGLHIVFIALIGIVNERNPVASFSEFLSILSLGLLIIYLYLETRFRNRSLGPWVLGFASITQALSSIFPSHPPGGEVDPAILSAWYSFHMVMISLAFASLLISALFSIMYLVLHRSLKRKSFDIFFNRFLPLATLGEMNYQALVTGLVFLILNIPVAFVMVYTFNNGQWDFQYCMYFTYFIIYTFGVILGKFAGWRGNRLAFFSLAALSVLVIATIAAKEYTELHAWF